MELTQRKKQILKIVVDSYINTAEPVGSKAIVALMPEKVSSATVRNELADLTDMGYLEQPHTSAGRIPSARGYRLYVNELMERRSLSREEEEKLNTSLAEKLAGTDQVMARAGQMVSSFVGYPAYTVADHKTAATVRRFELIPVDANSFIAVVMLSDSQVKSQLLPLQLPVADGGLPDMSRLMPDMVKKKLAAADPMSLVQETCVAECVHCWLVVLSVGMLFLWKSVWSWALWLVYNLLGNVSFILIQRYNRPRLLRLAEKENKKNL